MLAGVARSSYYYQPRPTESLDNLRVMGVIDSEYLKHPYYGSPRMTLALRDQGYQVNHKRVERLMRVMGLSASWRIVPGPHTSRPHPDHRVYPYLLKGLAIQTPNEVWCADITYIPMSLGYLYSASWRMMDWFSRYVLAWELSNTLEAAFCVETVKRALAQAKPRIFNTDQGAQFTSVEFTTVLENAGVEISMDGRGRAMDPPVGGWSDSGGASNTRKSISFDYRDGIQAHRGLSRYFRFYNFQRRHQGLDNRTPAEVHFGRNGSTGGGIER